jgi:hypothetical protein
VAHFHSFCSFSTIVGALSYETLDALGEIRLHLAKPGDPAVLKTHAMQRKSIYHEVKGKQNNNKSAKN